MPAEYAEFEYHYQTDGDFIAWLAAKDNDNGWELITIEKLKTVSGTSNYVCVCIFRKKIP